MFLHFRSVKKYTNACEETPPFEKTKSTTKQQHRTKGEATECLKILRFYVLSILAEHAEKRKCRG